MHNLPQIQLSDYFDTFTGRPRKCCECGSEDIRSLALSFDGGYQSESAEICYECGTNVGYFAYGHYDPVYMMDFAEEFHLEIY